MLGVTIFIDEITMRFKVNHTYKKKDDVKTKR